MSSEPLDPHRRLRDLRQRLEEVPTPGGPDGWDAIERWAASARPLIRAHFAEHLRDFESVTDTPPWSFGGVIAARINDPWGGPTYDPDALRAEEECNRLNAAANARYGAAGKAKILDYIDGLLAATAPGAGARGGGGDVSGIKLFVSHSESDQVVAKALVRMLESATTLRADQIRCTSVPGYKLAPGDRTSERLRREIEGCDVLIGLLTERSIASCYVLMELGAAWGFGKTVCGVLAPSVSFGQIPGPFKDVAAIKWDSAVDLSDLIAVVIQRTAVSPQHSARERVAVDEFLDAIKLLAPPAPSGTAALAAPVPVPVSDKDAVIKLKGWLGKHAADPAGSFHFSAIDKECELASGTAKRLLPGIVSADEELAMTEGDDWFSLTKEMPTATVISKGGRRRW